MKKIILAVDALDPDPQALEFACYLARLSDSVVTGIFLENLVADELPVLRKAHGARFLDWEVDETDPQVREKMKQIQSNIEWFEETCGKRSVRCSVHRNEGLPAREIIDESRYADLLVMDAATSFRKKPENVPTDFVKDVLKDAECPVIIAPGNFKEIDEIIFANDGSSSALFAIKQFTYLFPEFGEKKATLFEVQESVDEPWKAGAREALRGWMKHHYSSVGFETAVGESRYELYAYLFAKRSVIIVMGAFGRSALSQFFRTSNAELLIKSISQPLFIAHR